MWPALGEATTSALATLRSFTHLCAPLTHAELETQAAWHRGWECVSTHEDEVGLKVQGSLSQPKAEAYSIQGKNCFLGPSTFSDTLDM